MQKGETSSRSPLSFCLFEVFDDDTELEHVHDMKRKREKLEILYFGN